MKKFSSLSEPMKIAFITGAFVVIASVLGAVIGGVFLLASKTPSVVAQQTPLPPPTHVITVSPVNSSTGSPTSNAIPSPVYQVDFSSGIQGWITSATSSQWTYNGTDKVLESNGSLPCCSYPTTLKQVIIAAPYTVQGSNYSIEARIRVVNIPYSYSHDYSQGSQPFFGFYIRGNSTNLQGYITGLNFNPGGDYKVHSFLVPLNNNPTYHDGGVYPAPDQQWHTYRIDVQGNTVNLYMDNVQINTNPLVDDANLFPAGQQVGIEDYDYTLQIQNFKIYTL